MSLFHSLPILTDFFVYFDPPSIKHLRAPILILIIIIIIIIIAIITVVIIVLLLLLQLLFLHFNAVNFYYFISYNSALYLCINQIFLNFKHMTWPNHVQKWQ